MPNDDVEPEDGVDPRVARELNGHPTPGASPADAATPVGEQSSPEQQLIDLRGRERRTQFGPSANVADEGMPPRIPGWRFVDDGAAIAFSDGHALRRTIVLPVTLGARPERGLRRALRAIGGLSPGRRQVMANLDQIRWLTLLLVVTTEYRELLYQAALSGFEGPVLVERDVRLLMRGKDGTARGAPRVMDEGRLRVDLDRFTFTGTRYTRRAWSRLISSLQEDIDGGHLSVFPLGGRPWQLDGVSPVGVFAAASACRMNAEEAQRHRGRPGRTAAELLDPMDPSLPKPGNDLVLELEGLCRVGA